MAKRKKGPKVQKRAKLRRGNSAKRSKPRKAAKSAATKRTVAKPKPAPAKKVVARKGRLPVGPAVETVAAEVIERPVAVTAVEETRQAS